jgi:hypothetical protein
MATTVQKMCERLSNHTIVYNYTAQMCEGVYCTLVHGKRDINAAVGSFEKLKEQGVNAYLVVFGGNSDAELNEISKPLFTFLRQQLEEEVRRNDAGIKVLVGLEESQKINNSENSTLSTLTTSSKAAGEPKPKKRRVMTPSLKAQIPAFPDLKAFCDKGDALKKEDDMSIA